ncbi:MAG TPA: antibiotic biosynthesis monooxygenase [Bryobacteraceae bacterium]|nr:antibiotic biosynthesis monooxygenase [Bryobacteraceae bacterium]
MIVVLFRSRLVADVGEDYAQWLAEMKALVHENPGFIDIKAFLADDGERLSVVRFRDEESLRAWATNPRHLEAQRLGRLKWYESYTVEVLTANRSSEFSRAAQAAG